VLAAASISHSGAIASIKPAMLKEALCFLLVTQIGEFMAQPQRSLASVGSGGVAEMEALGSGLLRSEQSGVGVPGSVRPTPSTLLFIVYRKQEVNPRHECA
jgi:hypothetical protein